MAQRSELAHRRSARWAEAGAARKADPVALDLVAQGLGEAGWGCMREVAAHGSFSAAAESLAFTQPAVSRQIATLEAEAGARLVDRSAPAVEPMREVLRRVAAEHCFSCDACVD